MSFRILTFLAVLLFTPTSAFAFWMQEVETCAVEIEAVSMPQPCEISEDGEENNVCLEAAAFPISTTHSLLKWVEKWQKDNNSDGDRVLKQIAEVAKISLSSMPTSSVPKKPLRSCSLANIGDCEFMPAVPLAYFSSFSVLYAYHENSIVVFEKQILFKTKDEAYHYYQFSFENWDSLPSVPPPRIG